MLYGNKAKQPVLTNQEIGCWQALENRVNYMLKIRKSTLRGEGNYCLYDANMNPLATWPRGVVEGLILKNKLQLDKATGYFKTI